MHSTALTLLALSSTAATVSAGSSMATTPSFNLYVPIPDEELLDDIFEKINAEAESPVTSMISLAVPTDGTIVWYDHWEDGYDDLLVQASTAVWGDGDSSNGCAPIPGKACNDANDVLNSGDVILLKNKVYVNSRNPNVIKFDGGDLIKSTYPVVMTRAGFPSGPGSMMAGAVEVFDQSSWGTSFEAPVGKDVGHLTSAYQFTSLAVMAGEDDTEIMINGAVKTTLDQGGSIVIEVDQSDTLVSSKPVQVHLITGDIGSRFELRWYALPPTSKWSTTAYAPVGDTMGEVKVTLYNPGLHSIDVECIFTDGSSATLNVPSKGHIMSDIIDDNVAAKFVSEGNSKFFAFSSTDTEGSGQIFDWGYPLMTEEMLTPQIVVGLGFGCTDNSCDNSGERSIVWITPVEDAEIWIDFDNDGTTDKHKTLNALQPMMVTDDDDEDMSGAVIWATEKGSQSNGRGVKLAGAWGQKAALSKSNDMKALDLGTVVVPFEPTFTCCSIDILEDRDGNGVISTGDLVKETIEVLNVGNFAVDTNSFAVSTGGGVVNLDPMEIRGDVAIYTTTYVVPPGETVLGSCELIPYDPSVPEAPGPEPAPAPEPSIDEPEPCPIDMPAVGTGCNFMGPCPYGSVTCCDGSQHIGMTMTCVGGTTGELLPGHDPCGAITCPSPDTPDDPPPAPDSPSPDDKTTPKAFTKGDPHFKTFGGELYDYHGECDLVLLHNPEFKEGLGMDIHVRTKIDAFWSSVESAVLKIGKETLEIKADPESAEWLWSNGKEISSTLQSMEWYKYEMSGFLVRYMESSSNVREANIYLKGSKEVLLLKTFKRFVRVDVDWEGSVNYEGSVGLLGSKADGGKRLGRDGQLIEDANAFGQEWQVRPEVDGSLFHSYEGAVVGKPCVMPPTYHEGDSLSTSALRGRRLGASALDTAAAEKACAHLKDAEDRKACVFDVVATQDLSMAGSGWSLLEVASSVARPRLPHWDSCHVFCPLTITSFTDGVAVGSSLGPSLPSFVAPALRNCASRVGNR